MKKTIAIITTVLVMVCLSTVNAHADRKTMEGFMIGTGVAILGAAIINAMHDDSSTSVTYHYQQHYSNPPQHRYRHQGGHHPKMNHHGRHHHKMRRHDKRRHKMKHHGKHHRRHHHKQCNSRPGGYWEVKKRWMAPVYETRWNPGHYNRRGVWVEGRHVKIMVADGYWEKVKIWVSRH